MLSIILLLLCRDLLTSFWAKSLLNVASLVLDHQNLPCVASELEVAAVAAMGERRSYVILVSSPVSKTLAEQFGHTEK